MKFLSAKPLVLNAQKCGYAVPALNTNGGSYDIARAALEAAQELRSPLILQSYEPNLEYRGVDYFVALAKFLCDELDITVPVALQLDHGHSFDSVVRGMQAGLTSVMFDASSDPIESNIEKTRAVVAVAKDMGVSVEAEVGYVKGNEPKQESQIGLVPIPVKPTIAPAKTQLEEAIRFVSQVDVDMLAVSVGTTHGVYQQQGGIDFELLSSLRRDISTPLVAHGTCGISLEDLSKLAKCGMAKINFGEPFRLNYIKYFDKLSREIDHSWHPWKVMQKVKDSLKSDMKELIIALGADGKAADVSSGRT